MAGLSFDDDESRCIAGLSFDSAGDVTKLESYLSTISDDVRRESPIGLACLLDSGVYMGNQLLRDSDVMSMAHSLELRTPLVDVEVAKFSRTCLDEFKLRFDGGFDDRYAQSGAKRVLIQAMRDVLPADIATRPKRGFALPLVHWLRTNLKPMLADVCNPQTIARRGLIDPAVVAPLMQSSESLAENVYPRLWSLMLLELWCRNVLDAPTAKAAQHPEALAKESDSRPSLALRSGVTFE
jgi:asparagine synthase (glutamine-hydrolysing)